MTSSGDGGDQPLFRVVRGDPNELEIAALVAVLTARRSAAAAHSSRRRSVWTSRSRQVRPQLRPGPDAWRASSWPR
jgi:hypothetical protein